MAKDSLTGTHLRSHQAAVPAQVHVPAGERQLQADALISQAAAEVRDHQPGAAVWGRGRRGKPLLLRPSSERPSYIPTRATVTTQVGGAHRDSGLVQGSWGLPCQLNGRPAMRVQKCL